MRKCAKDLNIKIKEQALKVLKSKLYQIEMEKNLESKKLLEDDKKDIAWGQIRSYFFIHTTW